MKLLGGRRDGISRHPREDWGTEKEFSNVYPTNHKSQWRQKPISKPGYSGFSFSFFHPVFFVFGNASPFSQVIKIGKMILSIAVN